MLCNSKKYNYIVAEKKMIQLFHCFFGRGAPFVAFLGGGPTLLCYGSVHTLPVAHGPTKEDERGCGNAFIVEGQGVDKSNELPI